MLWQQMVLSGYFLFSWWLMGAALGYLGNETAIGVLMGLLSRFSISVFPLIRHLNDRLKEELKLTSIANLLTFSLIGQSHEQTVISPLDTQLVLTANSHGFPLAVLPADTVLIELAQFASPQLRGS
jgi:hypothetical protein